MAAKSKTLFDKAPDFEYLDFIIYDMIFSHEVKNGGATLESSVYEAQTPPGV
jgi:hypothetical protein